MKTTEQKNDLAQVISNFFHQFNVRNNIPAYKLRTLDAIVKCRTEYMGGHIQACECCGVLHKAFNSCRNRHCPKCGAIDKEKWILNREADLLPVKYFHVVFTVPDKLNVLFLNNQEAMYNLLFKVVWEVMKDFGETKKWIGGRIGATALLHTCGQNMNYHPHLHLIVPGGALMPNGKWKNSRKRGKYLFKVEQVSNVFRARFVKQVRALKKDGIINGKIPESLFDKDWVVYSKPAFGEPKYVIKYLGRYTHRTAISNNRILKVDNEKVTFTWKDYNNNYQLRTTSINGVDFLRLFCQNILPPGFTRIRHYGFISSASKKKSLAIIRNDLKKNRTVEHENGKSKMDIIFARMGIKPGICTYCGGKMRIIEIFPNLFWIKNRDPPGKTIGKTTKNCISEF